MKKRFTTLLLSLTAALGVQAQLLPSYQNFGVITNPPPINATSVENYGNIVISGGSVPFDTENTVNFTVHPTGNMLDLGSAGFLFQNLSGANNYVPAKLDTFVNSGQVVTSGRIEVLAADVDLNNLGLLSSDRRGAVSIVGDDVSLLNGRIRAGNASDRLNFTEGSFFSTRSAFYESPYNIREDAWGVTLPNTPQLSLSSLASFPNFAPSHLVQLPPGLPTTGDLETSQFISPDLYNFYIHSDFNFPNNSPIQGTVNLVVVETNVVDMPTLRVGFDFATNSNNKLVYNTVVDFSLTDIDPITGAPFTRYLTLYDEASEVAQPGTMLSTNFFQENQDRNGRMRPRAHILERGDFEPFNTFGGGFGLTPWPASDFDGDMIFTRTGNSNGAYDNRQTNYQFSSSEFTVNPYDYSDGGLGGVFEENPGVLPKLQDITNAPGRVEIQADQLDMTLARIRAENLLSITASNLVGFEDVILDAPNISLELLSTGGSITLSNFFPDSVNRMHGSVQVWSGVWLVNQNITNQAPATYNPLLNRGLPATAFNGSNTIQYAYHMTILDHDLSTNLPVTVQNLRIGADELILSDPIRLNDRFRFEGTQFTYSPSDPTNALVFTDEIPLVNSSNFPNLQKFTNNGVITVPRQANFGFDRTNAYACVVNNGEIRSESVLINADYFQNTNTLHATTGAIFIQAATNRMLGGLLAVTNGTLSLSGGDHSITNAEIYAQRLFFDVTQRLSDEDTTNTWHVSNGFSMLSTPAKGDLLATEIISRASTNASTLHQWAGEDRGDHPAGYANNSALAKLTLDGDPGGRFIFSGVGGDISALYVDTLQLNNYATNFESSISVSANFKLYFSQLVDTNNEALPADKFTNAHSGRICWVSESTRSGPMVQVPTGIGTSTTMSTRALRALLPAGADYDGDGILNQNDVTPLSGFTLNEVSTVEIADPQGSEPVRHAKIVWQALPDTTYIVEYRDSVSDSGWNPLSVLISTSDGEMTAYDRLPAEGPRFYRVRFSR